MTNQPRELTLTATQVERLRTHLLRDDAMERIAYAYCSPSGDDRLLVEELVLITDEHTIGQDWKSCRADMDTELELVDDCLSRGMQPCIIHSHPFDYSPTPGFSTHDNQLMDGLFGFLTGLVLDAIPMFAVMSQSGIIGTIYPPEENEPGSTNPSRHALPITVIGNHRLDTPLENVASTHSLDLSDIDSERFDRTIRAIGDHSQRRLADTHIAIVGCGGLGDFIASELAMAGVGEFTLIDPDSVETSNLPRLVSAADHHVSRPKVEVTKQHLWRQNPATDVTTVHAPVEDSEEHLYDVDLVVAGVDRISTRQWMNAFAVRHLTPYIDAGTVIKADATKTSPQIQTMEGYIQTILPGATACFDCLKRGDPERARVERLSEAEREEELERGYIDGTQLSPEPAVVPLNALVASKTVEVVAQLVTGYADPPDYVHYESFSNTLQSVSTSPIRTCHTCGVTGVLGRGTRDATGEDHEAYDLDLALEDIDLAPASIPDRVAAAFAHVFNSH